MRWQSAVLSSKAQVWPARERTGSRHAAQRETDRKLPASLTLVRKEGHSGTAGETQVGTHGQYQMTGGIDASVMVAITASLYGLPKPMSLLK